MPTKRIAAIDGNSLLHRAFHAVPATMNAADGRPTNACFGFLSMLLKFIDEFHPDVLVCAFDAGIPEFRLKAIDKYKAQRPPTDPDLKVQFPIIEELLLAMGIPVVRLNGWEGDDILGSLAAMARDLDDCETLLVTGDKDALQLVGEKTFVVNTKTGMSDIVVYDSDAVVERFGVPPARVVDYLGLMGDSSDNIPGVPGIGKKTATKLLLEYGSMDNILDNADQIKGKLGENIRNNKEQALASREVATIICDLELDLDLGNISFPNFEEAKVRKVFASYGFNAHLGKVLKLIGRTQAGKLLTGLATNLQSDLQSDNQTSKSEDNSLSLSYSESDLLYNDQALRHLRKFANSEAVTAHIQKADEGSLFDTNDILYLAIANKILILDEQAAIFAALQTIAPAGELIAFKVKDLLRQILLEPSLKSSAIDAASLIPKKFQDLSIAAYLLDSSKNYSDILQLAADIFGLPTASDIIATLFAKTCNEPRQGSSDAKPTSTGKLGLAKLSEHNNGIRLLLLTRFLHTHLQRELREDDSLACYEEIELPLIPVLLQMELNGVRVLPQELNSLSGQLALTLENLHKDAIESAGLEFNPDSPKQLAHVLFEHLGLPARKKKTTGYSTDASVLEELKPMHPLPGIMLEYRELAKLKNTYLDALPGMIAVDGHIHTTFNQAIAATGRLSSSDPNLQNIPVRSKLGREIRRAFVADAETIGAKRAVFLSADYSQIELRLLAHLSEDPNLIAAFAGGLDFHSQTAAQVFGVDASAVSSEMRTRAKAVNFGIVYGQQAYGLSQSLQISFREAQEMIERYFAVYPTVRSYLNECVRTAREQGWVQTMFGRKRHTRELESANPAVRNFGERAAMNHPLQGSAADIIKLAMIEVNRAIAEKGLRSQLVLQVHDELDFNCDYDELEIMTELIRQAMENVVQLKVQLLVDISHADNWAEAH